MTVRLLIRNESKRKRLYRGDVLKRLAERIFAEEGVRGTVELSVLFCDDDAIQRLNRQYRGVGRATDVLAFSQVDPEHGGFHVVGDIVISLQTVERRCADRRAMQEEVRLLFCHGVLHLLGYDHVSAHDRERMATRQAALLGTSPGAAWLEAGPVVSRGKGAF